MEEVVSSNLTRSTKPFPQYVKNLDAGRVEQILGNLLSNALRYTPEQGKIELALHQDARAVQVTAFLGEDPAPVVFMGKPKMNVETNWPVKYNVRKGLLPIGDDRPRPIDRGCAGAPDRGLSRIRQEPASILHVSAGDRLQEFRARGPSRLPFRTE